MIRVIQSDWTADHVAGIGRKPLPYAGIITDEQARPILPGFDLWDMWPVQTLDGKTAQIAGGIMWLTLCAPVMGDPIHRHMHARIRLIHQVGDHWHDLGSALDQGLCPGNREWSGSAILDEAGRVTLFFTAAGIAGSEGGWQQRLFQASAALHSGGATPGLSDWSQPLESVKSDADIYVDANQAEGEPGKIKAFRDPGFFRDPADGSSYLLFAGSLGRSANSHNGCIGLARASETGLSHWQLLPPLVCADGLNNELERPHIIVQNGHYYLFWSTQSSVFAPDGPIGPTGLYGMVASSLFGPYAPLNETGLVIANPAAEPTQAYSWLVLDDLRVISFVDSWGLGGKPAADEAMARAHFGGTPAPVLTLTLDGATSHLEQHQAMTA